MKRNRAIRVDDEEWEAAQRAADTNGEPLAQAIRRFLRWYAAQEATPAPTHWEGPTK